MGLVQRRIEKAGISTLTISPIPDFTASVGAPRIAALEHPLGVPLGKPGDRETHRGILVAALSVLERMDRPGAVAHLPFTWPDPPRRSHYKPPEPPPIVRAILRKPWLFVRFMRGDIP